MKLSSDPEVLAARRDARREALSSVGDLRPGSLRPRFRKCGKSNCRCSREGDRGHGPKWVLSRMVAGKMRIWAIPDDALAETQRQVNECRRFRDLVREMIEVGGKLCEVRLSALGKPARPAKMGA